MKRTTVRTMKRGAALLLAAAFLAGCAALGKGHDSAQGTSQSAAYESAAEDSVEMLYASADEEMLYASAGGAVPGEWYAEGIEGEEGGFFEPVEEADPVTPEQLPDAETARKLITTVDLSAETEDFTSYVNAVENRVQALGGYVESVNVYNGRGYETAKSVNRFAYYCLRIPVEHLDAFLQTVQEQSHIVEHSRYVEDVTLHYVDTKSRKEALEKERDRLLELMDIAESLEDIIALEDRLTMVRYEIERIGSTLRTYDNRIDYCTVNLSIQEVTHYTPAQQAGVWQRMAEGFRGSIYAIGRGIREGVIWLVAHLPQIAIAGLVLFALYRFYVKISVWVLRKMSKRRSHTPEETGSGQLSQPQGKKSP